MDGCLPNLFKYLLFVTNFLVFLMAIVVCGFGIFALVDVQELSDLIAAVDENSSFNLYRSAAIILIVVSVITMIITFFGCCGAIKENRCMLGTYFTIILGLFIVMIVGAVLGYSQDLDKISGPMRDSIPQYDPDSSENKAKAVTKAWDNVQKDFKCCGVDSYEDWSANSNLGTDRVPPSCCQSDNIKDEDKEACARNPGTYSDDLPGCFKKFEDYLIKNEKTILGVAIAIVVIMFLNMIASFAMCTMATS